MSKESFESLKNYQLNEEFEPLVEESMLFEKDKDGPIGSIMNRGATFIPRAMRFGKAKKTMKTFLERYTKKSKNLIQKFAKSFKKKVDIVQKEYKSLLEEKIKPLVNDGENAQAVKLMKEQLKEIENYKKEQMQILDKSIQNVLDAYTSSIHNRIDNPGFVLNVELSERGKGELKAKWQELIGLQQAKIEEYKTTLIQSEGWKLLDNMISEMTSFIENRGTGTQADIDFLVQDLIEKVDGDFEAKIHLRVKHGRVSVKEKGILIGPKVEELVLKPGTRKVKEVGKYQYNARPYDLIFTADEEDLIRPYIVVNDAPEPFYGDAAAVKNARPEATTPEEKKKEREERKRGDDRILMGDKKPGGSLQDEEPMVKG